MNELRRQAYMSALGIESYMPRWRLLLAPEPVLCPIPLIDSSSDSSSNSAVSSVEEENHIDAAENNNVLTPYENNAVVADVLRHLTQNNSPSVSPAVISPEPRPQKQQQQKIAPFALSIWRPMDDILIIDSRDTRLAFPTELLLKNILQTIFGLTSTGKEDVMRWPLVENPMVPQSEDSARNALEVWIEVELERRPAKKILLMGSNATRYFLPADTHYSELLWCAVELDRFGAAVIVAPSLVELLQNPLLKRELWQALQYWSSNSDHA